MKHKHIEWLLISYMTAKAVHINTRRWTAKTVHIKTSRMIAKTVHIKTSRWIGKQYTLRQVGDCKSSALLKILEW